MAIVSSLLLFLAGALPPGTIVDYRQCAEPSDYNWPRFKNESALLASPWKAYLNETYGALPTEYPFCTYDLWTINSSVVSYKALGLKPDPTKPKGYGVNHTWHTGEYNNGDFYANSFGLSKRLQRTCDCRKRPRTNKLC